jgi:hypothetical protein
MSDLNIGKPINRSLLEAQKFLQSEILGAGFPIWYLIEHARADGFIGKPDLGQSDVIASSGDMAFLLISTLAGSTPQSAHKAMPAVARLRPNSDALGSNHLSEYGLCGDWWSHSFVETISLLIDAWRHNPMLGFWDMKFTVVQDPFFCGKITWSVLPYDQDETIAYDLEADHKRSGNLNGRRRIAASYTGDTLMMTADWLEGRDGHCVCGGDN